MKVRCTDYHNPLKHQPIQQDLLGNGNGILNYYNAGKFDSAIAYIDTALHYRYFIDSRQVTDFPRNLEAFDRNGGSDAAVIFNKGRYRLLTGPTAETASRQK